MVASNGVKNVMDIKQNLSVFVSVKKVTEECFNVYLNGKFYIGTVQRYDKSLWTCKLLWNEGNQYSKDCKSKNEAFLTLYKWIQE